MDELRREYLKDTWSKETDEKWTQEWREDLTPEELDYVAGLDRDYDRGVLRICSAILVREKVRARYSPKELLELETIGDHCRLRLRDGRMLLARLGPDNSLRLHEIEEEKNVIDMTTRELEQALRERDEARAEAQTVTEARDKLSADNALLQKLQQAAAEEAVSAKKELEAVQKELEELRSKPVDVAVMAVDQEKLDTARAEAIAEMQAKVDRAKAARNKADAARKAAEEALSAANAKLEEATRAEKKPVISSDRDLAAFELLFGQAQEIANKLHGLLLKARRREDTNQAAGMQKALAKLDRYLFIGTHEAIISDEMFIEVQQEKHKRIKHPENISAISLIV